MLNFHMYVQLCVARNGSELQRIANCLPPTIIGGAIILSGAGGPPTCRAGTGAPTCIKVGGLAAADAIIPECTYGL